MQQAEASPTILRSGGALHIDGPAGAAPVLFLHGIGGGAWSWRPQRDALSTGFRLFIWEARGHGAALRVTDAGVADYFVDAKEALAAAVDDARRPIFVVGHSLGGWLAIALAAEVAAATAGLFLIEPLYVAGDEPLLRAWLPFGRLAAPAFGPLAEAATAKFLRPMFVRQFENAGPMERAWSDQQRQLPFEYPQIFREALGGPKGFPLRDFAKEISDATFVLEGSSGKRRPRIGLQRLVKTLHERLGEDFTYESVSGGHYLQLDRPDVVNDRLERFVKTRGLARKEERR